MAVELTMHGGVPARDARVGQVEALLDRLDALPDPAARELATATVQALLELYGEGLRHVVERIGPAQARALADDELVAQLLLLHGLHPVSVERRVRAALEDVRPYLGSHGGDVELLGVAGGVVRLRLQGSCEGCPASAMTLRNAIEEAILQAAPDVDRVEAEGVDDPAHAQLLQIECAPALAAGGAAAEAG
jgi:Fe-S cluster biogenesis protein NfuA